jgi:hypothetical protein
MFVAATGALASTAGPAPAGPRRRGGAAPPHSLAAFLNGTPAVLGLWWRGREQYLHVTPGESSLSAAAQGMRVYVFDQRGELVDWTTDRAADDPFCSRWEAGTWGGSLTAAQAQEWLHTG